MLALKIKGVLGLAVVAIVTMNVTACVKNNSKNQPQIIEEKDLGAFQMDDINSDGTTPVEFSDESGTPIIKLRRDYQFTISEISLFRVIAGDHNNSACDKNGAFIYNFYFIGENGEEKLFNPGRDREQLFPGTYTLRLVLENGAHCKNVSMKFELEIQKQPNLVNIQPIEAGLVCRTVEAEGELVNNLQLEIKTSPLRVTGIQVHNSGNTAEVQPIIDQSIFCGRELPQDLECIETSSPVEKSKNAVVSIEKKCRKANNQFRRSHQAQLRVYKNNANISADFACSTLGVNRKSLRYNLQDCRAQYVFGASLTSSQHQTEITILPFRTEVQLTLTEAELNRLPDLIYVSAQALNETGEVDSLSGQYTPIAKSDLKVGTNLITLRRTQRLFRHLKNDVINPEQVHIVLSEARNKRSGLLQVSFKELCSSDPRAIVTRQGPHIDLVCN